MPFKILSLDGGGSWAMIQARVLLDLYGDVDGHAILHQFDMAIANSGGSLVLACLCNNMKPSAIINIFESEEKRKMVFSPLTFWEKLKPTDLISLLRGIIHMGPKYSAERKYTGLRQLFIQNQNVPIEDGIVFDTKLSHLPSLIKKKSLQLLFVGFDYFRERANFFRSNLKSETDKFSIGNQFDISLGYAIQSSSNAPVNYFDAPATVHIQSHPGGMGRETWYWDGAVSGFNNPVLAGVVEATTNNKNGLKPSDFHVLSIGTATASFAVITDYPKSQDPYLREIARHNKTNPLAITKTVFRFFNDVRKMATSILDDPPDSATFIAYSMLDPTLSGLANLVRINPCLQPELDAESKKFVVPEVYKHKEKDFIALVEMDMDATENDQVKLIHDLCDKFITEDKIALPNQLIRGNKDGYHLGYKTYREAKAAWNLLK